MNLKTKSKLDVVSDSLRISKDDILAYGDVKLYVYFKDEAQKGWQDANITGTASVHLSKSIPNAISLTITNQMTRQLVFRCRSLEGWKKQYDYWYSFDMRSEPACPYLASLSFLVDEEGVRFDSIVSDLRANLRVNKERSRHSLPPAKLTAPHNGNHRLSVGSRSPGQASPRLSSDSPVNISRKGKFRSKISNLFHHDKPQSPLHSSPRVRPSVSSATNFNHVTEYNRTGTIDMNQLPIGWKKVLADAGLTEEDLKDPKTARFVMKSIGLLSQQQNQQQRQNRQSVQGTGNVTIKRTTSTLESRKSAERKQDTKPTSKPSQREASTSAMRASPSQKPAVSVPAYVEAPLLDFSSIAQESNPPKIDTATSHMTLAPQSHIQSVPNPFDFPEDSFEPDFSHFDVQEDQSVINIQPNQPSQQHYSPVSSSFIAKGKQRATLTPVANVALNETQSDAFIAQQLQQEYDMEQKNIERDEQLARELQYNNETSVTPASNYINQPTINMSSVRSPPMSSSIEPNTGQFMNRNESPFLSQKSRASPIIHNQEYYNNPMPASSGVTSPRVRGPSPVRTSEIVTTQAQPIPVPPPFPGMMPTQNLNEPAPVGTAAPSLEEALQKVQLRPTSKTSFEPPISELREQEESESTKEPTSLLLQEILQCKLKHVADDIPPEIHEEDVDTFATSLANLIQARRGAINGEEESSDEESESPESSDEEDNDWL